MTKLFVCWKTGSCNMGDCDWGLEAFDSMDAVLARIEELKHAYGRPVYDFTIHVMRGTDLSELMGYEPVLTEKQK